MSDVTQRAANIQILDARARSDEAKADAAKANEASAQATERAAILEKEAALARQETERLKATILWRQVTPEQVAFIVNALRGVKVQVSVASYGIAPNFDPEIQTYKYSIDQALQAAGISLSSGGMGMQSGPTPKGIFVSKPRTPEEWAVWNALKGAGIDVVEAPRENEFFSIIVGGKANAY